MGQLWHSVKDPAWQNCKMCLRNISVRGNIHEGKTLWCGSCGRRRGKERGLGGVASDCDAAWRKSQLGWWGELQVRVFHYRIVLALVHPLFLITGWEQPGLSGPLNVVVECEIAMDRSCQLSTFLEARFFLKGDMSDVLLRLSTVLGILSLVYSRCHTIWCFWSFVDLVLLLFFWK